MTQLAIVMDNGTGFTKLGFAGHDTPHLVFPTVLAVPGASASSTIASMSSSMNRLSTTNTNNPISSIEDLYFGEAALEKCQTNKHSYGLSYPLTSLTRNDREIHWDHLERLWSYSLFEALAINPQDHAIMLTESPILASAEHRQQAAEIMFESFQVPQLCFGAQAVLAMAAAWSSSSVSSNTRSANMTAMVIDAGESATTLMPVVDGYLVSSAIQTLPIGGKQISLFIQQALRERESLFPSSVSAGESKFTSENSLLIAKKVKEQLSYCAPDMLKEFIKYDREADLYLKKEKLALDSNSVVSLDIGYEKFMATELFFQPEISTTNTGPSFDSTGATSNNAPLPLPLAVHQVIQNCPIDTRRPLYKVWV